MQLRSRASIAFQIIAERDGFLLDTHGFHYRNDRTRLEHEGRQHRAELVNGKRIVAVEHHVPAPISNADDEQFDLEVAGRLPLGEDLEYPLLGILVLDGRALRTFVPGEHVLHADRILCLNSGLRMRDLRMRGSCIRWTAIRAD